jgi:hypothetical protein
VRVVRIWWGVERVMVLGVVLVVVLVEMLAIVWEDLSALRLVGEMEIMLGATLVDMLALRLVEDLVVGLGMGLDQEWDENLV